MPSKFPTLGAVLHKAILMKDLSEKKIYQLDDLVKETRLEIVKQWQKANSNFSSQLVFTDKSIDRKIKKVYIDVGHLQKKVAPKRKKLTA